MYEKNTTFISTIFLLGFQVPQNLTFLVFSLLLLISCVTICGNLLIITVVSYSKTLHSPMYFLLSQLSVSDILLVMDIHPTLLHTVFAKESKISFSACITQFYIFGLSGALECLLLTVMSYDRYVAICKPLHYTLIMTDRRCWRTVIACWILAIMSILNSILAILILSFCGPNVIDHFFCDFDPILELSCTETTMVKLYVSLFSAVLTVVPFGIILVSYIYIIVTILKIPSNTGRKKAFSTCSSHLTVVSIFYGSLVSVYLFPHRGQLRGIAKFLSLMFTVVTPLVNPITYSLRNKDLKEAMGKFNSFLKMYFKCCSGISKCLNI